MVSRYGDDGLDSDMMQQKPIPEYYPSGRAKRKTAAANARGNQVMTEDDEAELAAANKRLRRTFFSNMLMQDEVSSDLAAMRVGAA